MRAGGCPNVVLIMTDQHHHLGYGFCSDGAFTTPAVDGLAAAGTVFATTYSSSTNCAPARGSIITGLHPPHYPTHHEPGRQSRHLQPGFWTALHELRAAGYETALVGKGHYRPLRADHGYDTMLLAEHTDEPAEARWMDDHTAWLVGEGLADHRTTHYFGEDLAEERAEFNRQNGAVVFDGPTRCHPTSWITERAVEWIEQRPSDRPWFAQISFPHPHAPWDPPAEYVAAHDPDEVVLPDPTAGAEALPERMREILRSGGMLGATTIESVGEAETRRILSYIRALIHQIDDGIATILEHVDLNDTVVMVTSDHGDYAGHRGLLRKSPAISFEHLARVGLVVAGGGTEAGRTHDEPVQTADIAPTLLDLAGLPPRPALDGRSLVPQLAGTPGDPERPMFCWSHDGFPMLRRGRHKLIADVSGRGDHALFDLGADPDETDNLAATERGAPVASELARELWAIMGRGIPNLPRFDVRPGVSG